MAYFCYLCAMKVAFTGHRECTVDINALLEAIEVLYRQGYTVFMSGMAEGFDLAAAEAVLQLKEHCDGIELISVIPFEGHRATMSTRDKMRYDAICLQADQIVTLADGYSHQVYAQRNDYLIDNSDIVLCYYSGRKRSGTGYTVCRGLKKGLKVINLYADGEQITFFGQ